MLSEDRIRQDAHKAGIRARKAGKVPKLFKAESQRVVDFCRSVPYLGSYVPEGWYLEAAQQIDSSAFGRVGELALTRDQFVASLKVGKGYGVIETGEFQVFVGIFGKN